MRSILLFALAACSGKAGTSSPTGETGATPTTDTDTTDTFVTDTDPQGACGDPVLYDLQVTGQVMGPSGPSPEAHVILEDRVWAPGILAETYTDGEGHFVMDVIGVTSLEGCWGLLGYFVAADKGTFYGERGVNSELFNAISSGTMVADLSFPLEMEDTSQ